MTWEAHIVFDPDMLAGKPIIKGTRIAVAQIIDLLAAGWTVPDIVENYPGITPDDIRACLAYAGSRLHAEKIYPLAS